MKTLSFSTIFCGLALAAAVFAASTASAQGQAAIAQPVSLTSDVKIERVETDAAGKEKVTLYTPKDIAVVPGDKVVFMLEVVNTGAAPAAGFRATNPMPGAVQFFFGGRGLGRGFGRWRHELGQARRVEGQGEGRRWQRRS